MLVSGSTHPKNGPALADLIVGEQAGRRLDQQHEQERDHAQGTQRIVARRRGRARPQAAEIVGNGAGPAQEGLETCVPRADETPDDAERNQHQRRVTEATVPVEPLEARIMRRPAPATQSTSSQ